MHLGTCGRHSSSLWVADHPASAAHPHSDSGRSTDPARLLKDDPDDARDVRRQVGDVAQLEWFPSPNGCETQRQERSGCDAVGRHRCGHTAQQETRPP